METSNDTLYDMCMRALTQPARNLPRLRALAQRPSPFAADNKKKTS